jgi:hypothetical protein
LAAPLNEPPPSILGFSEKTLLSTSSTARIVVKRSGNTNQTVSCEYQVRHGEVASGFPAGLLTFAPGETSRTIQISDKIGSGTFDISLFNNAGNATFIGGIKEATITFAGNRAAARFRLIHSVHLDLVRYTRIKVRSAVDTQPS